MPGQFQVPEAPMDFISMDLIGKFNIGSTRGYNYALTVICMLTGFTWCIPIRNKSVETIIKAYVKEVYTGYGGSRKILSDNGSEFKNELFSKVAQELEVEYKVYSPPYHPPSNRRIEGFHSFLKACLAKHLTNNMEWDEVVQFVGAVYNFLPNEHSREAPFFLMFGRDPQLPFNEYLKPRLRYLGNDETIISLEAVKDIYTMAAHNLKLAQMQMQRVTTQHDVKVKTGDLIMIKTQKKQAFEPRYEGYYRVVKIRGNQVDAVPTEGGDMKTAHIKHIKPILPADRVVNAIPDYTQFGRRTKLSLDPNKIPDFGWTLTTKVSSLLGVDVMADKGIVASQGQKKQTIVTPKTGPMINEIQVTHL